MNTKQKIGRSGGAKRRVGGGLSPLTRLRGAPQTVRTLLEDPLRRNSVWLMTSMIFNQALGAAFWLSCARFFPVAAIGVATGITSLMTITSMSSNVGAPTALVQLLPTRRTADEWMTTFTAGLIVSFIASALAACVAIMIIAPISPDLAVLRSHGSLAALFIVGTSLTTLSGVLDYVFIAERRGELLTIRSFAFGATKLPILVIPAMTAFVAPSVTLIVVAWVVGWSVTCGLGLRMVRRNLNKRARIHIRAALGEIRVIARNLAGNHFISLGNVLPTYLLPVIVITRLSAADNAYFYMTWMIGGIFFMISGTIGSSLFADGMRNPDILRSRVISSARFTAALALPAMLVAAAIGYPLLSIFGPAYAGHGYLLLLILTICAVPDAITNLYVPVLRVRDRLLACAVLTMGMALFAIVAAWIVAPSMGLIGIGFAWGVSQAVGSAWVAFDVLAQRRRRTLSAPASVA